MEWMPYVHDALEYIENNLLTIENSGEVAGHLNMSEIYLQKGFQVLTGYTIAEYIRNRRLYQAALEVLNSEEKLTDIGLKYGFDSPDGFTRAFSRFHGINPSNMRKTKNGCRKFLPLKVEIQVKGGNNIASKTIKKYKFKVIGCKKEIHTENEKKELDNFKKYVYDRYDEGKFNDNDEFSVAMEENNIGEFGIRKNIGKTSFEYMIAGRYVGGGIPEGMCVEEIPEAEWIIVDHNDTTEGIKNYVENDRKQVADENDISDKVVIEWYETPDRDKKGFRSALWFQVAPKKEKKKNGQLKAFIIGSLSIITLIGVSILGIYKHNNSIDKNDTPAKENQISDEGWNPSTSNSIGSVADKGKVPTMYWVDDPEMLFNSNSTNKNDATANDPQISTEGENKLPSNSIGSMADLEKVPAMYWLDYNGIRYNSVDYNINPELIEVGVKIGEYMVYPRDDIPEYSAILSGEVAVFCQVYEITGIDKDFAVAVKRKEDTDKYQVFYNPSYKPGELHSFLESIR